MSRWLRSGIRRDACIVLAGHDELPAQKLKTALSKRYDERIDPADFRTMLDELQRLGHVESHTEELTDVYSLTEAGESLVRDHYEWIRSHVDPEP
ncbi:MAG: PadR family transcriptional regulator [Haloarculaceae archaeon]